MVVPAHAGAAQVYATVTGWGPDYLVSLAVGPWTESADLSGSSVASHNRGSPHLRDVLCPASCHQLLTTSYLCYPASMASAAVTPHGLTLKQEAFAQAVANGASLSAAYRVSYNVSPSTPGTTTWDDASELARHPLVRPRIQQLIAATQAAAVAETAWTKARLVEAAEAHRQTALTGGWRGVSSANGALEIIGRATGLLNDKADSSNPQIITRVTVVLNRGTDAEGQPRVTESTRVLDTVPGDKAPGTHRLDAGVPQQDAGHGSNASVSIEAVEAE